MAITTTMDEFDDTEKKGKKRKRDDSHKKFLVGARVEVRSLEEGFTGSWHCGEVIACGHLWRQVRYDNLLEDDGMEFLKETIRLKEYDDEMVCSLNYRGCLIRPIPVKLQVNRFGLNYGLCVDALVEDAWWEGVIFDYEDGSFERLVFFPDEGDAQKVKIDDLRVTQDWDEMGGNWKLRGNWKFLESLEELELSDPIPVSFKQFWYDLRQFEGYRNKIKEWNCGEKSVWFDLVRDWNSVYLDIEAEHALDEIEKQLGRRKKDTSIFNSLKDEGAPEDWEEENQLAQSLYDDDPVENVSEEDEEYCPSFSRRKTRRISGLTHVVSDEDDLVKESETVGRENWLPAGRDVIPEPKFCPEALETYLKKLKKQKDDVGTRDLVSESRMHLSHLGWKVEYKRHITTGSLIFRYIPPTGGAFYSLRLACQAVINPISRPVPVSRICKKEQGCASFSYVDASPRVDSESLYPDPSESHGAPPIIHSKLEDIPESWPQPLRDYVIAWSGEEKFSEKTKRLREKAKEYLLALGWTTKPKYKNDNRIVLMYVSPRKKRSYHSVFTACIAHCKEEENLEAGNIREKRSSGHLKRQRIKEEENLEAGDIQEKRSSGHLKRQRNSAFPLSGSNHKMKKMKASRLQLDSECKTHVLHSSKRARQDVIPSSAHRSPRTILSWLIESNMVLPREKVRYLSYKDDSVLGEGKINRKGIKCNCCEQVFGLTKFTRHVGSNHMRPSARIFLQDGRSLLDCQKQLQENNLNCNSVELADQLDKKNDYICSICHYGGTLVLCDQCPSAFHLNCLGIEDLPDGKWFCPSCQCGICGQGELEGDLEQLTDKEVLRCDQCNHEYHIGCVRNRGLDKLDVNPNSSWFCGIKCEKLFASLHELLGKSVPVGVDNLSWSILKPRKDAPHHFAPSDKEADTELKSKLNVALSVIHECFEPIKEPGLKTDLVEDVLFNNTSKLSRLNFWGFYTVLLEREDELISVATVRIHNEKVAEVPLVGTRVQYRRQGMCRILFDVLEQKLKELEVERLILPAVPQVLHTWTTSFGFSKMTSSERLEFLRYTFLDFQDTTMCQKFLGMSTVAKPTQEPTGSRPKLILKFKRSKENMDTDRYTIVPAEKVEWSQAAEQQFGVKNAVDSVATASPSDLTTTLQHEVEQNWHNSKPCIIKKCLLKDIYDKQQDYQCSHEMTVPDEKSALVVYDEKQQEKRGLCVGFYTRKNILSHC